MPRIDTLTCWLRNHRHRMSTANASDWLNDDGTAKDPASYREWLQSDPERWAKIEEHPEAAAVILGDDVNAFQELLKAATEVRPVTSSTLISGRPKLSTFGLSTAHDHGQSTRVWALYAW